MPKAKKANTTREAGTPDDALAPVIARMKEIAAKSGDSLLLADGPPHPDFELLDLCGDALHFATAAEKIHESRDIQAAALNGEWTEEARRSYWGLMAEGDRYRQEATTRLRRAKKMRAKTSAGIYAKALLVRCSKTGAAELAMSLAVDLLDCPGLRESLWPAATHHA